MSAIEIVVIAAAVSVVLGVIVGALIRRAKGVSSCCNDCSSCKRNACDKTPVKRNKGQ